MDLFRSMSTYTACQWGKSQGTSVDLYQATEQEKLFPGRKMAS